jgi:hypothetical protein
MNAGEFPEVNVRVAEKQEEYRTLPAFYCKQTGALVYKMELSEEERQAIYATGEFWVAQYTGGANMQPIFMSVRKEDVLTQEEESNP